mgnify:CR=1 FL=1
MDAKTMIGMKYAALGVVCVVAAIFILQAVSDVQGTAVLVSAAVAPMVCMILFAVAEAYRAGERSQGRTGNAPTSDVA